MKNLNTSFEALKSDLNYAWETRNEVVTENLDIVQETDLYKRMMNAANYLNCIDPGNYAFLKALVVTSAKNTSMRDLAADILEGKTLVSILAPN